MEILFNEYLTPIFAEDIEIQNIVHDILGTSDPKNIGKLVQRVLAPYVRKDIEKILFLAPSAGTVFGFLLKSGEKIVLKIYNRRISQSYLDDMNHIQQIFAKENFPAPICKIIRRISRTLFYSRRICCCICFR